MMPNNWSRIHKYTMGVVCTTKTYFYCGNIIVEIKGKYHDKRFFILYTLLFFTHLRSLPEFLDHGVDARLSLCSMYLCIVIIFNWLGIIRRIGIWSQTKCSRLFKSSLLGIIHPRQIILKKCHLFDQHATNYW